MHIHARWALVALIFPASAHANPTSASAVPIADALKLADVVAYASVGVRTLPTYSGISEWSGAEFGVLPTFHYGKSGAQFGGLEMGADVIGHYSNPASGRLESKLVLNAKLNVLEDNEWWPGISIGAMELDPVQPRNSMNLLFAVMSKTIVVRKKHYGRVTAGYGNALTKNPAIFSPTLPFHKGGSLLLTAYESPSWGPLGLVVEYFGGSAEVGAPTVAINISPTDSVSMQTGLSLGDLNFSPRTPQYFFFSVAGSWNMVTLLK